MTFLSQFLCRGDVSAVGCRSNKAAAVPNTIDLDLPSHEPVEEQELLRIMVGDDKVHETGTSIDDDMSATGTETEQEEELAGDDEEEVAEAEEKAEKDSDCGESTEGLIAQESTPMDELEPVQEVPTSVAEEPTKEADKVLDDEEETSSSNDTSSRGEENQDANEEVTAVAASKIPAQVPSTPVSQAAKVIYGPPRTRRTAYDLSQLLGESLLVKTADADDEFAEDTESMVDTNKALAGRAVVAVYIGSGQHKDAIALFDAGYDAKSLALVYGWASTTDDCYEGTTGFETMPNRWFMSEDYEMMLEKCPDQEDEVLIVLDPWSGKVLCQNALPQVLALDPTSSEYDSKAEGLMQSWITGLPMKQVVVGHMEIPLR